MIASSSGDAAVDAAFNEACERTPKEKGSDESKSVDGEKSEDPGLPGYGLGGAEDGLGKTYIEWSGEMTFKDIKSSWRSRTASCSLSLETAGRELDKEGRCA